MPSTRAPPKQPNDAVEDTQSNKRQRHEPDLLDGVDVFADRLSTKIGFWATVSAYISHGPNVEERTIRWQHMLKNMHIIGQAQKREQKTANGSTAPTALKHLQSATEASPLQKRSKNTSKATRTDTQVAADVDDSSDNVSETEGPSVRQRNRVQIPATPPQTPSPRRKTGAGMALEHQHNWRTAWESYIESHASDATTKWASGITNVLTYMFSHQSVDDIVRLTADIYQAKESITLHNSTITHTQVLSIKDGARGVALGYKALWSALEVATMSKSRELFAYSTLGKTLCALEEELDDIGNKPEIQLGDFARLYLEDRRSKPLPRDTRCKSGVPGSSHSGGPGFRQAKQSLKGGGHREDQSYQGPKNDCKRREGLCRCVREGALLLMRKSPWQFALDQVSDKTIRLLLEKLAANKAELCKISGLAKAVLAEMTQTITRAQEIHAKERSNFSLI
ncbi:hypothetical protein D6D12_07415 [Aureobasidium pullulans]|uniref:Uncharacterized protein n=1 Tax=Aureobasidium pullulans TaxID=5580 RepID=A0AB74JMC2_AURPU|nr:hypothetical protein D6D12_07415 [Aureobasidium pullulans]THX36896.1 hypothetical protein D6D11_09348 [Aureobasidium pullulans]